MRQSGETTTGFIITIMWHAVPPTEEEPVEFRKSIQSHITDEQWQDLITPGTAINERWKSQVDVIAFFLKQLKYADVPVLWRPYHEINGNFFWWNGRPGENGTKKLYRMLYDRLVNFHKLNNLIWVYNCNEIRGDTWPLIQAFIPAMTWWMFWRRMFTETVLTRMITTSFLRWRATDQSR